MNNSGEKMLFSQRLKQALSDAQHPISPTYLSKEFNYRYSGSSITIQAANNWLNGKAIPNQDKLTTLAIWLNKSTQWLRFGTTDYTDSKPIIHFSPEELDFFLKFKNLNQHQQQIIQNIINEFLSS